MRRIFPTTCPTVRMTRGKSFGGITASATIATTISLPMSKSNIEDPAKRASGPRRSEALCHRRRKGGAQPTLWTSLASTPTRFSIDRGAVGGASAGFLVVVGETFLERFHAFGDVAHDVGDLTFAAEQQERHRDEQHPVPNAQTTHGRFPNPLAPPGNRRRDPRCPKPKRVERQKQAWLGAKAGESDCGTRSVAFFLQGIGPPRQRWRREGPHCAAGGSGKTIAGRTKDSHP